MSEDLHAALKLYERRIPESERFETSDIVRWLREDAEQRRARHYGPRDYFLVAKLGRRVCGFLLLHYYPTEQLAFVAYLVVDKRIGVPHSLSESVSKSLLAEVSTQLNTDQDLRNCKALLLEVDRPLPNSTDEERIERCARIRLFCMMAEAQGFSLRAFDMEYRQPPLSVDSLDVTVPMLLMYACPRQSDPPMYMTRGKVRGILKFIYTVLYPEGYSDNEQENRIYKSSLRAFWTQRAKMLDGRVRMLDCKRVMLTVRKASQVREPISVPTVRGYTQRLALDTLRHPILRRVSKVGLYLGVIYTPIRLALDWIGYMSTARDIFEQRGPLISIIGRILWWNWSGPLVAVVCLFIYFVIRRGEKSTAAVADIQGDRIESSRKDSRNSTQSPTN